MSLNTRIYQLLLLHLDSLDISTDARRSTKIHSAQLLQFGRVMLYCSWNTRVCRGSLVFSHASAAAQGQHVEPLLLANYFNHLSIILKFQLAISTIYPLSTALIFQQMQEGQPKIFCSAFAVRLHHVILQLEHLCLPWLLGFQPCQRRSSRSRRITLADYHHQVWDGLP